MYFVLFRPCVLVFWPLRNLLNIIFPSCVFFHISVTHGNSMDVHIDQNMYRVENNYY